MHHQYQILFAHHSMSCETWSTSTLSTSPPHNILVIIEHLDSLAFHQFVQLLVFSHPLSHTTADEAHLALTHDIFHPVMHTLKRLGSLGVQIALLSATVGPSLVDDLFTHFGISHYVICREKTSRPNISYRVIPSANPEVSLDALLNTTIQQPGEDQALIYCRTTA
jgi:superfamily II DNA helicase RecQ